jgi:hypothetical protein
MWNDMNGLHVCVNAVMVNGSMINMEWLACMVHRRNGFEGIVYWEK